MKAIVYSKYGPPEVLQLQKVEKPAPTDREVLVKVHATTVTIGDAIMRSLNMPIPAWQRLLARLYLGIRTPRHPILGIELARDIESIGRKVTRFEPGDPVFASTFAVNFGGYAEYKSLPENGVIALKPANLTYEEAAAVPGGGMTAWQCLKKGKIQPGQLVLPVWALLGQIKAGHLSESQRAPCLTNRGAPHRKRIPANTTTFPFESTIWPTAT